MEATETTNERSGPPLPALCQSCGERGIATIARGKQPWCKCPKIGGPYVAPPGFVAMFVFEDAEAAAFTKKCGAALNALIEARDARSGRWVRCGRGWRELPKGNAKRDRLDRRFTAALRAVLKLQRVCSHPRPSLYDPSSCGVCDAILPQYVAWYEAMERQAKH